MIIIPFCLLDYVTWLSVTVTLPFTLNRSVFEWNLPQYIEALSEVSHLCEKYTGVHWALISTCNNFSRGLGNDPQRLKPYSHPQPWCWAYFSRVHLIAVFSRCGKSRKNFSRTGQYQSCLRLQTILPLSLDHIWYYPATLVKTISSVLSKAGKIVELPPAHQSDSEIELCWQLSVWCIKYTSGASRFSRIKPKPLSSPTTLRTLSINSPSSSLRAPTTSVLVVVFSSTIRLIQERMLFCVHLKCLWYWTSTINH